jgi:Flp pilus assembly protein TadB
VSYEDLHETDAPPAGEEVHLPGPTLIPFLTAIAITLIVVGTTLGWAFSIIGAVMLIGLVIRWVGDTRRDIEQLPEEHH